MPLLDLVTQLLLVVLGFALLFSGSALTRGLSLGVTPSWHQIVFALPLAMLAYTGLETVANLAEEARRPGRDLPRSLFSGIGAVVVIYVLIALVGLSAFPQSHGTTALGVEWLRAPIMGIVSALQLHLPHLVREHPARLRRADGRARAARGGDDVDLRIRAARVLARRARAAPARVRPPAPAHARLAGLRHRRRLRSRSGCCSCTAFLTRPVTFLASLFSFGVLLAFTAAQLAVVKLRVSQPELRRPFRVPLGIRIRGAVIPLPSLVGALLTAAVFVAAMVTHIGARYGGPAWLLAGLVVYFIVRRGSGAGLLEHVAAVDDQELPQAEFSKILVPMKLGQIGEEMVATAVKLAQERHASVEALFVIRVPLELPLDAPLEEVEEQAAASLAEAAALGAEQGVEVVGRAIRARSIGAGDRPGGGRAAAST